MLCQKIYPLEIQPELVDFGKDMVEFAKRNRLAHFLALEYGQLFKDEKLLDDACRSFVLEHDDYKRKIKNSSIRDFRI